MFRDLIFRCANKFMYWHQAYQTEKLKKALRFCGARVRVSPNAIIWGTDGVTLEDDVEINSYTHVFGGGGVRIGARTLISACCSITSYTHGEEIHNRSNVIGFSITIEEDCWLGTGAIILPGVHIGRGSIIGAGAVVTKDIPPMSVAIGVPARVVRQIAQ
jgi:acetyltransferase-like isoleucine patch superfamily enzyme